MDNPTNQSIDSPPLSPRYRRPRIEGPRSKSGCATCISKKVKCDESRPICARCKRLKLACLWLPPKERLALRRKGSRTAKDLNEENRNLAVILPKIASPDIDVPSSFPQGGNPTEVNLENTLFTANIQPQNSQLSSEMSSNNQDMNAMDAFLPEGFNFALDVWDPLVFVSADTLHITQDMFDPTTSLGIPRPNAPLDLPTISAEDHEALLYFRTTFSSLKSARSTIWSAHAVFFFQASQNQSALHFLLAVSHNEYALHQGVASSKSSLSHKAREHYEIGSQLLLGIMTGSAPPDPISDLISFLYMYMFWMRRETIYAERLRQISKGVLNYVMSHGIVDACVEIACSTLSSNLSQSTVLEDATGDSALVARLLTYIYDRDVYCSFFGCGGKFANFLNENLDTRRAIYSISRTFLLRYWGKNYPREEFTQDVEQARTFDMYFDLITICQRVNNCSQDYETNRDVQDEQEERKLRRILDFHQVEFALLFHLVAIDDSPRPKIPLLAYVSVTFFYAVQIYLLRCSSKGFGSTICPKVDNALSSLISTAHLAMTVGPVQLLERFQWALMIAGIETKDIVHQEWLSSSISDSGVKSILGSILQRKRENGGSITMSTIRQMLGKETEVLLPQTT